MVNSGVLQNLHKGIDHDAQGSIWTRFGTGSNMAPADERAMRILTELQLLEKGLR